MIPLHIIKSLWAFSISKFSISFLFAWISVSFLKKTYFSNFSILPVFLRLSDTCTRTLFWLKDLCTVMTNPDPYNCYSCLLVCTGKYNHIFRIVSLGVQPKQNWFHIFYHSVIKFKFTVLSKTCHNWLKYKYDQVKSW